MECLMAWPRTSRHERGYGREWTKLRERVAQRDGHLCQACARNGRVVVGNECHHIVPKARGGSDDEANLEMLCHACHVQADAAATGRTLLKQGRVALDGTIIDG
jgi:5-methylcytosine-specific restriction protein A